MRLLLSSSCISNASVLIRHPFSPYLFYLCHNVSMSPWLYNVISIWPHRCFNYPHNHSSMMIPSTSYCIYVASVFVFPNTHQYHHPLPYLLLSFYFIPGILHICLCYNHLPMSLLKSSSTVLIFSWDFTKFIFCPVSLPCLWCHRFCHPASLPPLSSSHCISSGNIIDPHLHHHHHLLI